MSVKNKDPKSHWHCKTVAFRVSPEEAERLDMQVQTAGMLKQNFIVKRVLNDEIIIRPNIRIQRAIIDHLDGLTAELKRLEKIDPDSYALENIRYLLELIAKLNPSE